MTQVTELEVGAYVSWTDEGVLCEGRISKLTGDRAAVKVDKRGEEYARGRDRDGEVATSALTFVAPPRRHDCGRTYVPHNAYYCWFCHCG